MTAISFTTFVFLVHVGATLVMVGQIWVMQIMHYPLYPRVGPASFSDYQRAHRRLAYWTMTPPMVAESATALLLVWYRPASVTALQAGLGLVLVVVIIASTFLVQIPRHARLEKGFDEVVFRELLWTNWIRTIAWTARGALVLWMSGKL